MVKAVTKDNIAQTWNSHLASVTSHLKAELKAEVNSSNIRVIMKRLTGARRN